LSHLSALRLTICDAIDRYFDSWLGIYRQVLARYARLDVEIPTGRWGENCAGRYLQRRGIVILDRNFQRRGGEIDLVGRHRQRVVFFEVKTFRVGSRSWGLERIDAGKSQRIENLAAVYLAGDRVGGQGWRFDAVVVQYRRGRFGQRVIGRIRWIQAIF